MTFTKPEQTDAQQPTAPIYHAYVVTDTRGEGRKAYWTKIGAMFAHKDGQGGTLVLQALPRGGKIVLRAPTRDDA